MIKLDSVGKIQTLFLPISSLLSYSFLSAIWFLIDEPLEDFSLNYPWFIELAVHLLQSCIILVSVLVILGCGLELRIQNPKMEMQLYVFKKFEELMRSLIRENTEKYVKSSGIRAQKAKEMKELSLQASFIDSSQNSISSNPRLAGDSSGRHVIPPRFTRIEFPKFSGENLKNCLHKCEHSSVV